MGNTRLVKYINELTSKERSLLMDVIKKYDFQVYDIFKARSAYKLITSKGDFCLKKMKHGERKILNGSILNYYLREKGFTNTAYYIKTKNGMTYIKTKKFLFYVTTWIDGNECIMDSIEEVINCTNLLAKFHLAARNIENKKLKFNGKFYNSVILLNNYINDFSKYDVIICEMKLKSQFDKIYQQNLDYYRNRGLKALDLLKKVGYSKLFEEAKKNKTICHNSFYYQNIMKEGVKYYIIDLDSIMIDVQVVDLAKFIRRLMYKKEFEWDFNYAKSILESYSSIKKISIDEMNLILAYITFPHKFWKIGKKRYLKKKTFSEGKFNHKLYRIIKYKDKEEKFIEDFVNFINDYNKG
ncbi:MAG: CotS family spore coat protein [Clostridiaceae bacterium]